MEKSRNNKHQRNLALHQAVAAKLRRHPELWRDVSRVIERWLRMDDHSCVHWAKQWHDIINTSHEQALALMVEQSERAEQLRQSSPFSPVLTNQERWQIVMERA